MTDILDPVGPNVFKKLSETHWSARHDAISALFNCYIHVISALF